MMKRYNDKGYVEITSEQLSSDVQYEELVAGTSGGNHGVHITVGYRRCPDFDAINQPGQDFVTVRVDENYVAGVVSDGVSRSFYGDIAAKHVSEWLSEALWENREHPLNQHQMSDILVGIEKQVALIVSEVSIPTHLPDIQRTVLEDRRSKGSQTVFAAFILDIKRSKLRLYQVGDVE